MHVTNKDRIYIDKAVCFATQNASNVDAIGVGEGDSLPHQLIRLSALQNALYLRQLNAVIDAHDLVLVVHDDALNTYAIVNR